MQDDGDGEPVVGDVLRTGWKLKGRVLRPAMVKVDAGPEGLAKVGSAARVVREGLLRASSASRRRRPTRRSRAPTRSWPSSTTPTPTTATRTRRSGSRTSPPRTTCSATARKRKEYDEVRRMVASGVGPGGGRRLRRSGGGHDVPLRRRRRRRRVLLRPARRHVQPGRRRPARAPWRRGRSAARPGPRDRTAPLVRRCRARHHEHGAVPRRRAVHDVRRQRRRAGHVTGDVPAVSRHRFGRGRPGTVLVLAGVPDVRWARPGRSRRRARRARAAASRCAPAR